MSDATVFSEKIRRPRAAGLVRPRLVRPFLDPAAPALGVVTAPAGSGKTTLLAHVAAQAAVPVGWYTVTADDRDETSFVRHLARAWCDAVGAADPAPRDVRDLAASLDSLPSPPCLLVVDDAHELIGTPVERALDTFLSLRPRSVRVIVGSRRAPDVNLVRRRLSGEVHVVDGDDLRFRFWEVEELFTAVHREPLSPEGAAELTRRTGGWAAGLRMFQFANSGRPAAMRRRAVTDLGSSSRWLTAYLARNVLAELGPARREFLLRTCALEVMTGALCDDLLETTGSEAVLAELEQLQLFTTWSDDGRSYRYHEVLRRHLESTFLAEHGEAAARAWYARTGEVLERAGDAVRAVHAHVRAEDWDAVARLVRGPGDAPAPGPVEVVSARLPQSDPWLALAEARRRVRCGDLAGAVTAFARAERLLDDTAFRARCRAGAAAVQRWLPGATSEPDPATGSAVRGSWVERLRDATVSGRSPRSADSRLQSATLTGRLGDGFVALLEGDLAAAATYWRPVAAAAEVGSEAIVAGLGLTVVALLTAGVEDPEDELEHLEQAAREQGVPWLARVTRGLLAAVLARTQEPLWRWTSLDELVDECDRDGDAWGAAVIEAAGALAADTEATPERAARAAARFGALGAPVPQLWADALGVRRSAGGAAPTGPAPLAERARALRVPAAAGFAGPPATHTRAVTPVSAPTAPVAALRCFGGFRLRLDGREVDLAGLRPRARSLLRLLALQPGRDRHRDWLVDVLWPDATTAVGTRRLQVAVSSVRHHLGDPAHGVTVRRTGDAYALALPDGAQVDVARFEDLVRQATRVPADATPSAVDLRIAALELYTGDLLPEEGTLEPVVSERERLRLVAAGVALDVAKAQRDRGLLTPGVESARRATDLEPYSDAGWTLLAELLEQAGDHGAAFRVRQRHDRLRQDLVDRPG